MGLRKLLKRIVLKEKADSASYLNYLRKRGATIGSGVKIYDPSKTHIDDTRCYLITIGDNVHISTGATILTHDFSWSVIKAHNGAIVGNALPVKIGNNSFIGWNAIILGGVTVGSNCVVGAQSVVTKDIPDNEIWAGNPAKKICSISDFYDKKSGLFLKCAVQQFLLYYKSFQEFPPEIEMHEFFPLWRNINDPSLPKEFKNKIDLMGNPEMTRGFYSNNNVRQFNSYEEFASYCLKEKENGF